jgi:hypothetical protein
MPGAWSVEDQPLQGGGQVAPMLGPDGMSSAGVSENTVGVEASQ